MIFFLTNMKKHLNEKYLDVIYENMINFFLLSKLLVIFKTYTFVNIHLQYEVIWMNFKNIIYYNKHMNDWHKNQTSKSLLLVDYFLLFSVLFSAWFSIKFSLKGNMIINIEQYNSLVNRWWIFIVKLLTWYQPTVRIFNLMIMMMMIIIIKAFPLGIYKWQWLAVILNYCE